MKAEHPDAIFHIIGAIGEFAHALMRERTMDGLAAARARGRTGGQKPNSRPGRSSGFRRHRTAGTAPWLRSPLTSASPARPSTAH
jgi:DNA invertase Pin-like site-specific DNA recombinase